MALSPQEEARLAQLEGKFKGALAPEETARLQELEKKFAPQNQAPDYTVPQTIQEMHPSVGVKQRAILKNFANSPESGLKYLQQELPGHEVDFYNGEYRVRKQGEKDFRMVDPDADGFDGFGELGRDVLDIGYDTLSGAVEGVATAAGAAGGAIAGAPVALVGAAPGAIAGGMAAGASSAAMAEGLRQWLGKKAGIPQEVDGTDVAISGAIGAASPLLLGAGKAKGAIQKGYEVGRNKVAPWLGSKLSGVSPENLMNYSKHMGQVDELSEKGISEYTGKAFDKVNDYAQTQRNDATENLIQVIDGSGKMVNIAPAKKSFTSAIDKINSRPDKTVSDQGKIAALQGAYSKYYGLAKPKEILNKTDDVLAQENELLALLQEEASREITTPNTGQEYLSKLKSLESNPKNTFDPDHDRMLSGLSDYLNKDLQTDANKLQKAFSDLNTFTTQQQSSQRDQKIKSLLDQIKVLNTPELQKYIDDSVTAKRAWELQKDVKGAAKFTQDMTVEDAYMKGTARDSYMNINKAFEEAIGDSAPEAKRRYSNAIRFEEEVLPKFEGPTRLDSIQKTYNTLSGLDKNSKRALQEHLSGMAKQADDALDLTNESEILGAYSQLGKPALMPISSGGTTATARTIGAGALGGSLGSLAGYNSGAGFAGATVGGIGGAALGTMIGGPAAMRNYIKMVVKSEQFGNTVKDRLSNLAKQAGIPEDSILKEAAKMGIATETGKSIWEQVQAPYYLKPN